MYAYDDPKTPQVAITMLDDSGTRSPYHPSAEKSLQAAVAAYKRQSWGDALLLLGEALQADPRLEQDPYARSLAKRITGNRADLVLSSLSVPQQRSQLIAEMQAAHKQPRSRLRDLTTLLVSLGMALLVVYAFAEWLPQIKTVFDEISAPDPTEIYTHTVGDVAFDVYVPMGQPLDPGWSMLVILGDQTLSGTDLLPHFLAADGETVVYVVPHLPQQPTEISLPIINDIISETENIYPTALDSVVLYGFGDGGELATLYARRYPNIAAGAITSGATFIHAPAPDGAELTVMLGDQDPLYTNSNGGNNFSFVDPGQWMTPMPYLLLEGVGHEIDPQQVDLALDTVSDIHADALE